MRLGTTLVLGLVSVHLVLVSACGSPKKPPAVKEVSISSKCPDLAKGDELAAFDFAKEYNLSRDAGEKLKAAALVAMEVSTLSDKLDAELGIACAQIAHDLGNRGDWRSGNDACAAAIKTVHDARAKLGPKAVTQLVVRQPTCTTDLTLMTKCASICDSSVAAEKAKADCAQRAGRCDGNCEGTCEPKLAAKCDGVCSGLCEGAAKGTCGGKCRGTCDGKPSIGPCAGVCAGVCEKSVIVGECKGMCNGTCKLAKAAICDNVCNGSCTVEMADAKCAGEFKSPEVSSDCRSRCELEVLNKTECGTPQVGLVITGASDKVTAEAMRATVDKSFPALLKVLSEVGEKGANRVLNAQQVIESARAGFKDMARSGGAGTAAAAQGQLEKCFDDAFKKAEAAAAMSKTGIDQAIGVRDEATKQ